MRELFQTRLLTAGECLFREGEPADALYLVERGEMEVLAGPGAEVGSTLLSVPADDPDGGAEGRVLNRLGPGSLLGELGVIDRQPRSATVVARTDVVLTRIAAETVHSRLRQSDPVLRLLFLVLARHFRSEASRPADAAASLLLRKVVREAANDADVLDQLRLAAELETAVEDGTLDLAFQPVVALPDGAVLGFEALLRWRSRGRGLVAPDRFIPVAEATAMILPIGRWCLQQALEALVRLRAAAGRPLFMSINVAARQMEDDGFLDIAVAALGRHGLESSDLHLEIIERALLDDHVAGPWLMRCRMLGLPVALDDFGSGYSSLRYLSRYPIDTLKIDRAFVAEINADRKSASICRAVIELGAALDMRVIAEGIETPAQADLLAAMGCRHGQGWLYRRALPLEDALALVAPGE